MHNDIKNMKVTIQLKLLILLVLLSHHIVFARESNCNSLLKNAPLFQIDLQSIHPTQFSVGLRSVKEKEKKLEEMSSQEKKGYLKKHPIPVVIGPEDTYYSVDKHHLALALLDLHQESTYAYILDDLSELDASHFWEEMIRNNRVYLKNENGQGPLDPNSLPHTITELRDDPYRSLAAAVRLRGGYEKSKTLFSEFRWADFFRERIVIEEGERGFKKAVKEGVKLAHSPEAKDLPGYIEEDTTR